MEKHPIKRIENHTSAPIILPMTDSFPHGIRLLPGLNSVPTKYLDELTEYAVVSSARVENNRKIPAVDRRPGQEVLADLQVPCTFPTANGDRYGQRVTIYEDALEDREDGPPPPLALPSDKNVAKKLVELTTDRKALERWSKASRGEVQSLVNAKLAAMGAIRAEK